MTVWLLILAVLITGAGLPLQAGINAQLARFTGHPVTAALVSFGVGTLGLLAYALAVRVPGPAPGALAQAPWWAWTGGLLGAVFVAVAAAVAHKIGAAVLVGVVVAGQMLASLLLDHLGAAGFTEHPVTPLRLVGALLLVAGVVLIKRF